MVDVAYPLGSVIASRSLDRRLTARFPLQQEVRYRLIQSKAMVAKGVGQSLNISSGGVQFTTTERLPVGRMAEIAMDWPARLNGTCAMQFVARGRIMRSDGKTAVIRIQRYEFRTRAATSSASL